MLDRWLKHIEGSPWLLAILSIIVAGCLIFIWIKHGPGVWLFR